MKNIAVHGLSEFQSGFLKFYLHSSHSMEEVFYENSRNEAIKIYKKVLCNPQLCRSLLLQK